MIYEVADAVAATIRECYYHDMYEIGKHEIEGAKIMAYYMGFEVEEKRAMKSRNELEITVTIRDEETKEEQERVVLFKYENNEKYPVSYLKKRMKNEI